MLLGYRARVRRRLEEIVHLSLEVDKEIKAYIKLTSQVSWVAALPFP